MELVRFPLHRGLSVRSILTFVLAVLATALLWATIGGGQAHAATTATWSGTDTILFDGHGYTKASSDLRDTTGTIPAGATSYQTSIQTDTRSSNAKRIFILYFAPGVDPPTATSVNYVEFDYNNGTLTNPTNKQTAQLAKQGTSDSTGSSCAVGGVGWWICPISSFLGDAMDNVFNFLSDNFIKTQPPKVGDTNNSMYAAWNVMRTIANIAFVIVFLIIIHSQLTNIGISNYGLKKLIPRLIIAAILVNLSYYIAALAIDLSNVIGYSIQDIFNGIRKELFNMTNDNMSALLNTPNPWTTVTAVILGGGGLIGGIYYVSGAGLYFLVPLLIGLLLTIIFVVVILAARQAIIVILVIIAPLAFVANLLPNTEKLFDKWKDLFITMLVFFPAFALVFGGSQLAGQLIIQNAGDNIITVLFGLAVQIAPLVITPLILKLSGGLLGKIAQITNNPRKGIIDTPRNWANEKAELRRQRQLGDPMRAYKPFKAARQILDRNKRNRHEKTEMYKQRADNKYHSSRGYEKIHIRAFEVEVEKQIIDDRNKKHIQSEVNRTNSRLNIQNAQLEAGKRALETTVKFTEATVKEYNAGVAPDGASPELAAIVSRIAASNQETSLQTTRASNADATTQRKLAEALTNNQALRKTAAGIKPGGEDSVLAAAKAAVQQADAQDIKNIQETADIEPGDLKKPAQLMVDAIRANDSIRARAFQNMLLSAGGAGMDKFREIMIKEIGASAPAEVATAMQGNLLANHGAIKAKANDLMDWAAKGSGKSLQAFTEDTTAWAGLSNEDFVGQHPKTQIHALATNPFSATRAASMLDDAGLRAKIAPDIIARLNIIAGRPADDGPHKD